MTEWSLTVQNFHRFGPDAPEILLTRAYRPAVITAGNQRGRRVKPKERQGEILALVERDGATTVDQLAAVFEVSAETIRRDLAQLAETGVLQKVHGGARRLRLQAEGSFDDRMSDQAEGKLRIAAKLRQVVEPGDTCFIDTGTTTLACAQALAQVADLTVITNSARIAHVLGRGEGRARVFLLGGSYAPDNGETVGPLAIEQIGQFRADHAVIGAAALDATGGAMDADMDEAAIARAMCAHAGNIIVVAHAEKIGRRAAHRICRLDEIDMLVCDERPPDGFCGALAAADVALR